MTRRFSLRGSVILSALVLAGCGLAPGLTGGSGEGMGALGTGKAWTYAALSASDNDLSEDADVLMDATRRNAGLANVAPVLFVDRARADDSLRLFPGPDGAAQEKIKELDSESPSSMKELLKFAAKMAPSKRRLLVLADHGGGVIRGINSDEHRPDGAKAYEVADWGKALAADPVDILYFDACFMQMIEVSHDLAGTAEVILASESETTSGSAPHADFMRVLDGSARAGVESAASRLVEAGAGMVRDDATLSAVRPAAVKPLIEPFGKLATDLVAAMKAEQGLKGKLREAIGKGQQFVWETDPHYRLYNGYRDLGDTLDRIASVAPDDIARQATKLASQVRRDIVIGHVEARTFSKASGITIYAPADDTVDAGYLKCAFARETKWGDFLVALNSGGKWANPVQPDKYPRSFRRPRR